MTEKQLNKVIYQNFNLKRNKKQGEMKNDGTAGIRGLSCGTADQGQFPQDSDLLPERHEPLSRLSESESRTFGADSFPTAEVCPYLQSENLSTVTRQSYVRALRAFLTWCYSEDLLLVNLSEKFRLPKAKRKVIDILTDEEARRLMSSFNLRYSLQLRNYCICALMLDSGLRMDEVSTLDLSLLHLPEGYAIVNGKGNKQRVVPLGLNARKALLRYLNRRPGCASTGRVFLKSDLQPISDSTIKQMFRKLKNVWVSPGFARTCCGTPLLPGISKTAGIFTPCSKSLVIPRLKWLSAISILHIKKQCLNSRNTAR